jgi:hypothetical protein
MNWGQIKTTVTQYLENEETTFTGNMALYARLAEEDIYRKVQLPASRATAFTQVISGDRFLTQPIDCLSVYSLFITVSGESRELLPKDPAFLREAYPTSTPGVPRFYATHDNDSFVVAPIPDNTYQIEANYFIKLPSISAGDVATNTTWLSQNAENALLFGIIMHGYIFEKGDQDVIQSYGKQFEQAIADLKMIVEGRQQKNTYRAPDQRVPT